MKRFRLDLHITRGRPDRHSPEVGGAHQDTLHDRLPADPHRAATLPVALGEPALEPLHPTARVHDALTARVERVAHRTNVQVYVLARCRARLELVAARAPHDRRRVLGMYIRLHQKPPSAIQHYHLFYYARKGSGKGGRPRG